MDYWNCLPVSCVAIQSAAVVSGRNGRRTQNCGGIKPFVCSTATADSRGMAIAKGKFIRMDHVSRRACLDCLDCGVVGVVFQSGALGRRSTQCGHTAAKYTGAGDSVLLVDQGTIACACKRSGNAGLCRFQHRFRRRMSFGGKNFFNDAFLDCRMKSQGDMSNPVELDIGCSCQMG